MKVWILGLALWVGFAPPSGADETRIVLAPNAAAVPRLAPLVPLDVRDAAVPSIPAIAPTQIAVPELSVTEALPDRPLAASQIRPTGGALEPLTDSPEIRALSEPGPAADAAVAGLFDGNPSRVALLKSPVEALDARADMIADAKETVFAAYYRFHMDAAGFSKLAMLRDAARRGRDVRLVLDYWGSGIPKPMLRYLIQQGVKIRFYHPWSLHRLAWAWRRSHDKWTIVDGKAAILGDANMGKHYFGMGSAPWTSREVHVEGGAAAQAHDYAAKLWDSGEVRQAGLDFADVDAIARASARLDAFAAHFAKRRASEDFALKPWRARARAIADASFTSNPVGRRNALSGTGLDLIRMIRSARETIVIENSYIVLPEIFKLELRRAIRRGVRVVMLTNSAKTNNQFWASSGYEADVPELVRLGVELWEYDGPGTLHAKSMVIDGQTSYVGSFNLDPRSLRLNTETGLIVQDADFARDLLGQIRRTQTRSSLIAFWGHWIVPRKTVPVLSQMWGMLRTLLLLYTRPQV